MIVTYPISHESAIAMQMELGVHDHKDLQSADLFVGSHIEHGEVLLCVSSTGACFYATGTNFYKDGK